MIYLDNGATSFHKPESVYRAVEAAMRTCANPGRGGYTAAMEASRSAGPESRRPSIPKAEPQAGQLHQSAAGNQRRWQPQWLHLRDFTLRGTSS